jgi:hypothetical protein
MISALASIYRPIRRECIAISTVSMITGFLPLLLSANGEYLYWIRAAITTLGAVYLCRCRTLFGFYQASIYAMTLALYAALAYDVAQYNTWAQSGATGLGPISLVWGDRYRSIAHGLVICQFAGFFPILWASSRPFFSMLNNSASNLFWGKGSIKR